MNHGRSRIGPAIAIALFAAVLGTRFFLIIRKYSVNIFFFDQWDYLIPFFQHKATVLNLFLWEHGPHREGIGLLPDKFLYPLTHWDARVDSYLIGGAIFIAMLLALRLKYRLFGSLSYSDVAIPVIFLTMEQHEAFPLRREHTFCGLSSIRGNSNPFTGETRLPEAEPSELVRRSCSQLILGTAFQITFQSQGCHCCHEI